MSEIYESKAVTKEISASVKISFELENTWYAIQYGETRTIPENIDVDVVQERIILQDDILQEVCAQIKHIKNK